MTAFHTYSSSYFLGDEVNQPQQYVRSHILLMVGWRGKPTIKNSCYLGGEKNTPTMNNLTLVFCLYSIISKTHKFEPKTCQSVTAVSYLQRQRTTHKSHSCSAHTRLLLLLLPSSPCPFVLVGKKNKNRTTNEELPSRQEYDTVCLFADVSGFTTLSEAMMVSSEGVEGLARHLNSYFGQMVRIIASEGGDVFKV